MHLKTLIQITLHALISQTFLNVKKCVNHTETVVTQQKLNNEWDKTIHQILAGILC